MLWNGVDLNTHGRHIEDELPKFYGSVNPDVLLIGWTQLIRCLSVIMFSKKVSWNWCLTASRGALTWWKPLFMKSMFCSSFGGQMPIWPI